MKIAKLFGFSLLFFLTMVIKPEVVFGVDETEVQVSSPDQFISAWNNPEVRKIELKNDINTRYASGTLVDRTEDIEVYGSKKENNPNDKKEYFELYLYATQISLTSWKNGELAMGYPKDKQKRKMHFHELIMENSGGLIGESSAIVSDAGWVANTRETAGQYWELTFGNIIVPPGETTRLARASRAQINLYGKVNLSTQSENFYTGGMNIAEGTDYYGEITNKDFSVIWFRASRSEGDAGTGDFIVEPNSKVKLRNTTGNRRAYPAIYRNWQNIIIGENSDFSVSVPGNAVAFGGTGKKIIAKKGAKVSLASLDGWSAITTKSNYGMFDGDFGSTIGKDRNTKGENSEFRMEPGSSLYVSGNGGLEEGVIDWKEGTNNQFMIDSPHQFDIRNTSGNPFLSMTKKNYFTVENSNLFMVKQKSKDGNFDYNNVSDLTFFDKYSSTELYVNSEDKKVKDEVNSFVDSPGFLKKGYFQRLSGIDKEPLIEWQRYATDAENKFNQIARVRTGSLPSGDIEANGDFRFESTYATKDEVSVKMTDSNNPRSEQVYKTDASGYISFNNNTMYPPGTIIKAVPTINKSGIVGTEQSLPPVVDATPPEPVRLAEPLTTSSKTVKVKDKEDKSLLYMKKNNSDLKQVKAVKLNDIWQFELDDYLEANDKLTIYSEDQAGKMPTQIFDPYLRWNQSLKYNIPLVPGRPSTNNDRGNINPSTNLNYIDATFKAAPQFSVTDNLAKALSIEKSVVSNTVDDKKNPTTKVGSHLTYKVVIKNDELRNSGKQIKKVKFSDDIWAEKSLTTSTGEVVNDSVLDFSLDQSNWHIKKNGTVIDSSKSTESKHLLSYKDIANQEGSNKIYKRLEASVGDLQPKDEIEISYEVVVNRGAVGEKITNTAKVSGENARQEILKKEASAISPGGPVVEEGSLSLVSVPDNIHFGTQVKLKDYQKMINVTKEDFSTNKGLTVKDTRAIQKSWKLGALVKEDMTLQKDMSNTSENGEQHQLKNGFSYVYNGQRSPLSLKESKIVFDSSNSENKIKQDASNLYHLTDTWGDLFNQTSLLTEGLKFQSDVIPNVGTYQGAIEWQIQDTIS